MSNVKCQIKDLLYKIIIPSFVIFNLSFAIANMASAQLAELGINPLLLERGGRPLGMGGAFVASSGDIYSSVYNPAGLAWAKGISVSSLGPLGFSFVQAYPNGDLSGFGLGIYSSNILNVPIPTGKANSSSNVVALSYATKLGFVKNLGIGVTAKGLVRETLWRDGFIDQVGNGWDVDLGLLWKSDWWSLGLAGHNILTAGQYDGGLIRWDVAGTETIPALIRFGAQVKLISDVDAPIIMYDREALFTLELESNRTGQTTYRWGSEWGIFKKYFFRLGYLQQRDDFRDQTASNFTYGFGLRQADWGFDVGTYFEPVSQQNALVISGIYSPRDWIVLKKLDFEKPRVVMEQPIESLSLEDNVVTYDDRIEISGAVKRGVSIYINGSNVSLNTDNSFRAVVPLEIGKNLVLVEARFEGEKKTWQYKVLRRARVVVETKDQGVALSADTENVETLATIGVIEASPQQKFNLESGVTRAELAVWVVKAAGLPLPRVTGPVFSDVPANHPQAPYIKAMVDKKLMWPYSDGTFRPDAYVTQTEGEALFKALGVSNQ